MGTIEPQEGQLAAFLAAADLDAPVTMLNLLRFRETAAYPAGSEEEGCIIALVSRSFWDKGCEKDLHIFGIFCPRSRLPYLEPLRNLLVHKI